MAYEHMEDDPKPGDDSARYERGVTPSRAASAAAAALGSAAGPGSVMGGAVVGAMAGTLARQSIHEANPEADEATRMAEEEAYWRGHYTDEPYVRPDMSFDYYAGAYRTGMAARMHYPDREFEDLDDTLSREYVMQKHDSTLAWESEGRAAARAAWDHMTHH